MPNTRSGTGSGISSAARSASRPSCRPPGRQFASSVGGLRYVEGSFDRHLLFDSLATEDITFGRGGKAPTFTGSGLGVTVDPARVDAVTVRREVVLG